MNQDRNDESPADNHATEADPAEVLAVSLQTAVAVVARLRRRFGKRAPDDFDELQHALMLACGAVTSVCEDRDGQAANNERLARLVKKLMRRFTNHTAESTRKLNEKNNTGKGGDSDSRETESNNQKERKSRKGEKYNKQDRSHIEEETHVVLPLNERCDCGGSLCESNTKKVSEYVLIAKFFMRTYEKKTMKCTRCGKKHQPVARPRLQGKSEFSNEFIAEAVVGKVLDARPVNRTLNIIGREHIDLNSSAAYRCFINIAHGVRPLNDLIAHDIRRHSEVVSLDETNVKIVLAGDEGAVTRGVLVMCRNEVRFGGHRPPAVHFVAPSRKDAASIVAFCEGLDPNVRVIHDGNPAHNTALKHHIDAHCWAHARRPIFEACESRKSPGSRLLLDQINALFDVEEAAWGLNPDLRASIRQERALPTTLRIREIVSEQLAEASQSGDYANALMYIDKRWDTLTRYIHDGRLEIDNNLIENTIRNFATARRISMFAQTEMGAEAWAILMTILKTAVMNGHEPKRYFRYVLRHADPRPGRTDWNALAPWNCKDEAAREPATDPSTRYIGRVMTLAEYEASRRSRGDPPLRIAAE